MATQLLDDDEFEPPALAVTVNELNTEGHVIQTHMLEIVHGPGPHHFIVGRDPQCAVCLDSTSVSREHATIGGPATSAHMLPRAHTCTRRRLALLLLPFSPSPRTLTSLARRVQWSCAVVEAMAALFSAATRILTSLARRLQWSRPWLPSSPPPPAHSLSRAPHPARSGRGHVQRASASVNHPGSERSERHPRAGQPLHSRQLSRNDGRVLGEALHT